MKEGKDKYYKYGNPDLYNYFSAQERKKMTEDEKAMWIPEAQLNEAIPKEVLDFQAQHGNTLAQENERLKKELEALKSEAHDDLGQDGPKEAEPETDEEAERKLLTEVLREKGKRVSHNTSIERLRERVKELEDAND